MLYLWLGAERLITQLYDSGKPSGIFLLWVTLAYRETLPTRNLPSEALRPKSCLYKMPYNVAAPVKETGDVIMHLHEPDFFWFTSNAFLRRPVSVQYWLLCPFFEEATCKSSTINGLLYAHENPNNRSKM
jgi:hypothetical protein